MCQVGRSFHGGLHSKSEQDTILDDTYREGNEVDWSSMFDILGRSWGNKPWDKVRKVVLMVSCRRHLKKQRAQRLCDRACLEWHKYNQVHCCCRRWSKNRRLWDFVVTEKPRCQLQLRPDTTRRFWAEKWYQHFDFNRTALVAMRETMWRVEG